MHSLEKDKALQKRAELAFPAGVYGHMGLRMYPLPDNYPQFISRADGGRIWDVDGNEYIDFMCAYGPNILGYLHPKVEEAARKQMMLLDCATAPSEVMLELSEKLIEKGNHADWSLFCKNGSDATSIACMVARAQTGRNLIIMAEGVYHGNDAWCSWSSVGLPKHAKADIITCIYNDTASLEKAVEIAGDDLAGIILTPHYHELYVRQDDVTVEFAQRARAVCDEKHAALVIDDVRCTFRFSLGSSWQATTGVLPDLCAMGKTLANGHPVSAVTGSNKFRSGASEILVTGSFWFSSVPFAASLATIRAIEEEDTIARMNSVGQRLRSGLAEQANAYGLKFSQSGPVSMPYFHFDDDNEYKKIIFFCNEAVKNGVYFHPKHNMFVCAAHENDIDEALNRTESAFKSVKDKFGG